MKTIEMDTIMNRIDRFDELGVFSMERVQNVYPVDKQKLEKLVKMIYSDDEITELVMNVIYMDDDTFNTYKKGVKLKIGWNEFKKGFNQFKYLRLF